MPTKYHQNTLLWFTLHPSHGKFVLFYIEKENPPPPQKKKKKHTYKPQPLTCMCIYAHTNSQMRGGKNWLTILISFQQFSTFLQFLRSAFQVFTHRFVLWQENKTFNVKQQSDKTTLNSNDSTAFLPYSQALEILTSPWNLHRSAFMVQVTFMSLSCVCCLLQVRSCLGGSMCQYYVSFSVSLLSVLLSHFTLMCPSLPLSKWCVLLSHCHCCVSFSPTVTAVCLSLPLSLLCVRLSHCHCCVSVSPTVTAVSSPTVAASYLSLLLSLLCVILSHCHCCVSFSPTVTAVCHSLPLSLLCVFLSHCHRCVSFSPTITTVYPSLPLSLLCVLLSHCHCCVSFSPTVTAVCPSLPLSPLCPLPLSPLCVLLSHCHLCVFSPSQCCFLLEVSLLVAKSC